MINIGIIGFGKMGQTRHEAIVATGKGTVVAAYDPGPQDFRGIPAVASAEEVIADPGWRPSSSQRPTSATGR